MDCPFPMLRIRVRDRFGALVALNFRIDTQADCTAIPVVDARRQAIPFHTDQPGHVAGLTGRVAKYRDRVRLVIGGREHDWPCDFVETPIAGLSPVLGRAGFLDEYAFALDSGFLILTRLGPLRRWWRGLLHSLWRAFGLVRSPDEPV